MSNTNAALAAIQKAGAAVYAADIELKACVKGLSQNVTSAMALDPFNVGNDALFENWKSLARFSETVAQIEGELKRIHAYLSGIAQQPSTAAAPLLALVSGVAKANAEPTVAVPAPDLSPSDVVVKRAKSKPSKPANALKTPVTSAVKKPLIQEKHANASALMRHLSTVLNNANFVLINQSAVARATGISTGSIAITLKQLIEFGNIVAGGKGEYKLGMSPTFKPA